MLEVLTHSVQGSGHDAEAGAWVRVRSRRTDRVGRRHAMDADIKETAHHRAEYEKNHAPKVKRHFLPHFEVKNRFNHLSKSSNSEANGKENSKFQTPNSR